MSQTLKVEGLAELTRRLRALPEAVQTKALRGMVSAAAEIVRAEADLRAPVYSGPVGKRHPPPGSLKKAIYKARVTSESSASREVWQVNVRRSGPAGAYYGAMVEYGTVKMAPHPYMRPAWDAKRQAALEAMGTYLAYSLPGLAGGR